MTALTSNRTVTPRRLSGERVEKIDIRLKAHGGPVGCYVYEVWDVMNRLVYAGIAENFERRWAQHKRSSYWLGEVSVKFVHVDGYRSRSEARQIEASLINEQSAIYNTDRELSSYALYLKLWEDPSRTSDPLDCVPVSRTIYTWVRG